MNLPTAFMGFASIGRTPPAADMTALSGLKVEATPSAPMLAKVWGNLIAALRGTLVVSGSIASIIALAVPLMTCSGTLAPFKTGLFSPTEDPKSHFVIGFVSVSAE